MMLAACINGVVVSAGSASISIEDRGLQYGDGLFETAALVQARVRFLKDHLARLQRGCERLGFACPAADLLAHEISLVSAGHDRGIVKLIVTRGAGGRGYRPAEGLAATRIVSLFSPPQSEDPEAGIEVRWCNTRCARNAQLAGLKHLNRLEQVLAQSESSDPTIAEGIMMDTEGEVVSATSSNLFLVIDSVLVTPDVRYAGIAGIMRGQVLQTARALGWLCEERSVWPEEVLQATEVFLTNAVRGVRPVIKLGERHWSVGSVTREIANALGFW